MSHVVTSGVTSAISSSASRAVSRSFAGLPAIILGLATLAPMGNASAQASDAATKPAAPVRAAEPSKPAPKPAAKPANATKPAAAAASRPATKPAAKRPAKPAPVAAGEAPLPAAGPEQLDAAERIFYGVSDCEFKQTMDISINPKYPAYVDVKFDKKHWTMKPVLSSTGALRLEDVKNTAVLIQITQKSMLLNTVTGQRLVDECVGPKQRELIELQRQAALAEKEALAAKSAAAAAAVEPAATK